MSITSCRLDIKLADVHNPHVGLWLDRMLPSQPQKGEKFEDGKTHPYTAHINQAANIPISPLYAQFYNRWKQSLQDLRLNVAAGDESMHVDWREAMALGRLAVGLGAEGVLENAIALHRTYGVPYIPGSALKGLAAAFARQRLTGWEKDSEPYKVLFGDTSTAGYITFFDALYVPDSAGPSGSSPLAPDVITVHHPKYYQGGEVPADWDSPTPVSFVSATGSYLVALAGPKAWVDLAFQILGWALESMGVGAKTSSGYGRMRLLSRDEQEKRPIKREEAVKPVERQQKSEQYDTYTRLSSPPRFAQPQVGSIYNCTIIEVDDHTARVRLDGLDETRYIGVFRHIYWEGKQYKPNNNVRLEIIAINVKTQRTIIELKRASVSGKVGVK